MFLDRNQVVCLDSDIKAIIKRLDTNKNSRIDMEEFSRFFYGNEYMSFPKTQIYSDNKVNLNSSISNLNSSIYNRTSYSPNRNAMNLNQSFEVKKVSQNLSLRLSPERRFSPQRSFARDYSIGYSPLRQTMTSSSLVSVNGLETEERQFVSFLQTLMTAESRIEQQKIDLAMKTDFNVEDAFRTFEYNGRGFLTESDLISGLNRLELYPSSFEAKLLMKRFDLQKVGSLSYADFFDIVTPFERDYRAIVEARPPNSIYPSECPQVFSYTTR